MLVQLITNQHFMCHSSGFYRRDDSSEELYRRNLAFSLVQD